MRVLGIDASITDFGWALIDTDKTGAERCPDRGRFQTSAKSLYVSRYVDLRTRLAALIRELKPDKVGQEFPVFGALWSEGAYGLFLYCSEALVQEKQDVVFWSPLQVKAHARESLGRPKGWKMMKPDMVEAAIKDTAGDIGKPGRWNHNCADAYLVARLSARFWQVENKELPESDLTATERKYFLDIKKYDKGKRIGETDMKGVLYRENERFFKWSQETTDGTSTGNSIRSTHQGTQGSSKG